MFPATTISTRAWTTSARRSNWRRTTTRRSVCPRWSALRARDVVRAPFSSTAIRSTRRRPTSAIAWVTRTRPTAPSGGRPLASMPFRDYLFEHALPSYAKQFISFQVVAARYPKLVRLVPYERLMKDPVRHPRHHAGSPRGSTPRPADARRSRKPRAARAYESHREGTRPLARRHPKRRRQPYAAKQRRQVRRAGRRRGTPRSARHTGREGNSTSTCSSGQPSGPSAK